MDGGIGILDETVIFKLMIGMRNGDLDKEFQIGLPFDIIRRI